MVDSVVSSFSLTLSFGHEALGCLSENQDDGLGDELLAVLSFIVRETFSLSRSTSRTLTLTLCPTETTSIGLVT